MWLRFRVTRATTPSLSQSNYKFFFFPYIQIDGDYKKIESFRYRKKDVKMSPEIKQISNKINSVLSNGDWYKISVDF